LSRRLIRAAHFSHGWETTDWAAFRRINFALESSSMCLFLLRYYENA
jgi:hypothetical protein